jgi:hypothetical protein
MIGAYDGRLLTSVVNERIRAAEAARTGRAGLRLRRAVRAAEAAHRRAMRADRRAIEAHSRLSGTVPARVLQAR